VLSIDEKTQALDRTQPMLPIVFDASEKRTHDYVRHGTTNLFAALNMGTGEVFGECRPTRDRKNFLAFLKKAVQPHAGKEIHVVLDNLSTPHHTRGHGLAGENPHVYFHFTPVGSFVDQPDRNLVRHQHPPVHPPRDIHQRQSPDQADP
jgi:transposase